MGTTQLGERALTSSKLALASMATSPLTDHSVTLSKPGLALVGTSQLIDSSVRPVNVTNASVPKPKLQAGDRMTGQLLGTDGTNLHWMASTATVTPIKPVGKSLATPDSTGVVGICAAIARPACRR